jgi:hypothetical protein
MKFGYIRKDFVATLVWALAVTSGGMAFASQVPSETPAELVRQTVQNEIKSASSEAKFMFWDRKQTGHGSQTKLVVETNEVTAGMLVAVNDSPLTSQQRQAEEARLEKLEHSAEELRKKQKAEKDDAEHTTRIMKALPDAFLYEPDGTVPGGQGVGKAGNLLVRLKFRPNPKYSPPSRVEQVLAGMQGYVLIDADEHRIAKIDGTLMKDVSFGWGILGHLDEGGHFLVEQGDVGNDHWEVTRMNLTFTGKELLFKSINIRSEEVFSNFRAVPSHLTIAQAVDLLKKQEAELADNQPQAPKPE